MTVAGGRIRNQDGQSSDRSVPIRRIWFAGFIAVAGQRIAVSIGDAQLTLSVAAVILLWATLLIASPVQLSGSGILLWLGLVVAGGLSYIVNSSAESAATAGSLFLLLSLYVALAFMPSGRAQSRSEAGQHFFSGMFAATLVGAGLAVVQAALMFMGRAFWDPLTTDLPESLQTQGFNTQYSTEYVDSAFGLAFKPNGVLFLEPSFLSLYCGLGLVWVATQLFGRERRGRTSRALPAGALLVLALALSISASGLPVLAAGLLPLVWRFVRRPAFLVLGVAALVYAYAQGLFDPLIGKATEGTAGYSSTSLRLVAPYELLPPYWYDAFVFGHGPGTAQTFVRELGIPGLQVPTVLKVAVEYGLVGLLIMALALVVAVNAARVSPTPLLLAALVAWLVPAEALLSAPLAALVFFVLPHWRSVLTMQEADIAPSDARPLTIRRGANASARRS